MNRSRFVETGVFFCLSSNLAMTGVIVCMPLFGSNCTPATTNDTQLNAEELHSSVKRMEKKFPLYFLSSSAKVASPLYSVVVGGPFASTMYSNNPMISHSKSGLSGTIVHPCNQFKLANKCARCTYALNEIQ